MKMSVDRQNASDPATSRHTARDSDASATSVLVVLQVFVSVAVLVTVFFLGMSVARCSSPALDCDFSLIANAQYLSYALVIAIAAAVVVGSVLTVRRGRPAVWIPVVGLVATVAVAIGFSVLIYAATGQGSQI
jgi:hypothetical protein